VRGLGQKRTSRPGQIVRWRWYCLKIANSRSFRRELTPPVYAQPSPDMGGLLTSNGRSYYEGHAGIQRGDVMVALMGWRIWLVWGEGSTWYRSQDVRL
jgi:hypothetical protein